MKKIKRGNSKTVTIKSTQGNFTKTLYKSERKKKSLEVFNDIPPSKPKLAPVKNKNGMPVKRDKCP